MKNVGEYIGNYRIVSQQMQTLACQFYRVESTLEAENLFVLKTWPEVSIFSQMGIDTFTQQAQALVDFHAPFFLPIRGYGIDDHSHPYLLLPDEACTLETLAQRRGRTDAGPILVEEATTILQEVGTALVAAHQQGIVHGSLSPVSILLTSEGSVLVADFAPSMVHTMHQRFSLKPAYRPPEMQESRLSDQYALATLAHQLRPQLTISEEEAVARAQSGDQAKRFTSVRKFLLELGIEIALVENEAEQEIRPAEPPRAKRVSVPTIPWSRLARSKRTRWGSLAALLLLFVFLGVPPLYAALPAAAATVTIVPMTRSLEQTFQASIAAQTNLAQQQVHGRKLQYITSTQSQSEPTSQGIVEATQARGQLVFSQINKEIDLSSAPLRLDLSNGLTVVTDDQTKMLAGSTYTINAHVQEVGSQGNLPANAVNGFYDVGLVHSIGAPPISSSQIRGHLPEAQMSTRAWWSAITLSIRPHPR